MCWCGSPWPPLESGDAWHHDWPVPLGVACPCYLVGRFVVDLSFEKPVVENSMKFVASEVFLNQVDAVLDSERNRGRRDTIRWSYKGGCGRSYSRDEVVDCDGHG